MNLRATLLFACLTCSSAAMSAGATPDDSAQRDVAIRSILRDFWGNAQDVHGQPIQPASAADRATVPVSRAAAHRALEAGNVSGLAQWCGLDWEPHYFSITRAARKINLVDKQIAFISVLHGAGQSAFLRARTGETCSAHSRERAVVLMAESSSAGLPKDTEQAW